MPWPSWLSCVIYGFWPGGGRGPLAVSDLNSYTYRKLEPSEAGALVAKGGMAEVRGRKWGLTQLRAGGRAWAGASFPRNKDYTQKPCFALVTLAAGLCGKIVFSILQMGRQRPKDAFTGL